MSASLDWQTAGFGAELVPVCGPDHGCASPGKVPHLPGWQSITVDPETWRHHRGNLGLRTRHFPALDVDVEDVAIADEIERVALLTLGSTARRTRANTARRLLLYRLEGEPFGKVKLVFSAGAVEILANGQQCVVAGVHHTGAAIEWTHGQPAAAGLATITEAGRDAVMVALRKRLGELGCPVEGEAAPPPVARVIPLRTRPAHARTSDADAALWALEQLDPDGPYDMWIRVGMAIHSRWPDDGGLDLWVAWSARGTKYRGRRDLEVHWRSFKRGKGVGLGTLIAWGRRGTP